MAADQPPHAVSVAEVSERLAEVREVVGPGVRVVAVTKGFPLQVVDVVVRVGIVDLGENYAQELITKAASVVEPVTWHAIGRLQRNKVRPLAVHVGLWHTIDRPELIASVATHSPGAAVLVQVNTSGEAAKGGCHPSDTPGLVESARVAGLDVRGLMTVGPAGGGVAASRSFASLRSLRDRLGLTELSMGMSGDLHEAVSEGATIVRVGTALLGPRPVR